MGIDILVANRITKSFNGKQIIKETDLAFDSGVHVFMGENGSGKSTLLKMLMGLTLPDNGDVYLFGENTKVFSKDTRSKINFMPASDRSLYYKLTATENLYYIGSLYGVKKQELKAKIPRLLELVGLKEEGKYVETFSTGMKKRLMMAKSLINDPRILYYDEIFSGLDSDGCTMAIDVIDKLKKQGKLVLLVTHQKDLIPKDSVVYELKAGILHVLDN